MKYKANIGEGIGDFVKQTDKLFLFLCISCSAISSFALYSWCKYVESPPNYRIFVVQMAASVVGIVAALIISNINYRTLASIWPIHAIATWGLVLLTFIRTGPFGVNNGTDNFSWIKLPMGMSLQPTELAKISFIITFALHLSTVKQKMNEPKTLLLLLLHMFAPILLVHFQGDDGTALVFAVIGAVMLFSAGLSYKYIFAVLGVAAVSSPFLFPLLWGRLGDYQQNRILGLLSPDDPAYRQILYQQNMARISIGAGKVTGRGFFNSDHHYVPENQNDFIFSYIAESIGFIGSVIIVGLLIAIILKTFFTAMRAEDSLGSLICI
ncbi:MAG: FtsW/RodA/SpoVE family cell cycle protein, partial [Oscillospiraceae bacterium]